MPPRALFASGAGAPEEAEGAEAGVTEGRTEEGMTPAQAVLWPPHPPPPVWPVGWPGPPGFVLPDNTWCWDLSRNPSAVLAAEWLRRFTGPGPHIEEMALQMLFAA